MTTWFRASGRVNIIGEHTDYTGGLALPMAIQLGTTVVVENESNAVHLSSANEPQPADLPLDLADPATVDPPWARYVAGVVAELRPLRGIVGRIESNLLIGAGLSSSASLQLALATALGFRGTDITLARRCQRAEHRATSLPVGIMDQLAIAAGRRGMTTLIDCGTLAVTPIPWPDELALIAVDSGSRRHLAKSGYATRRAECAAAEETIGPLRHASLAGIHALTDRTLRCRARHVVSENERVRQFTAALATGDRRDLWRLLNESHESLRQDFEVTTAEVDELVRHLRTVRGVYGARMTGGGFGGMVIALCDPTSPVTGLRLKPSAGLTSGAAGDAPPPWSTTGR